MLKRKLLITYNTGAAYTSFGQRIAVWLCEEQLGEETSFFYLMWDLDRQITYAFEYQRHENIGDLVDYIHTCYLYNCHIVYGVRGDVTERELFADLHGAKFEDRRPHMLQAFAYAPKEGRLVYFPTV